MVVVRSCVVGWMVSSVVGCTGPARELCDAIAEGQSTALHECPDLAGPDLDPEVCTAALEAACSDEELDSLAAQVECLAEDPCTVGTPDEASCVADKVPDTPSAPCAEALHALSELD